MGECRQRELFELPMSRTPEMFWRLLNDWSRRPVSVTLTRNRVSMVSVAFGDDGRVRVRVNEIFLNAPEQVLVSLADYIRTRQRRHWKVVGSYARAIEVPRAPAARRRAPTGAQKGKVHDLEALAHDVNRRYFSGRVRCGVQWGIDRARRARGGQGRSIRYGSWSPATRTIRLHPRLDDARVPREFVEYILFHEMLHAIVPARVIAGRRVVHSPEFQKLERTFPNRPAMQALARELLDVLTTRGGA
jgi:hypothetical protein